MCSSLFGKISGLNFHFAMKKRFHETLSSGKVNLFKTVKLLFCKIFKISMFKNILNT